MINKDPVISVVIPAFRRPKLLKGAIASVLRQSFSDLELIVVDDDAQASAQAVVSTFKDPRISYVAQGVSRGGSAARNAGLMRARGELIAFLDDDDEWSPDFLEVLSKVLRASSEKVGVVYCPVEFMNVDGARRKSVVLAQAHGDVFASILAGERSIVGTVALVRRKVFDVCGGFDEALPSAQDWDMWIRAAKHFHFEYVLQPLATVRDFGPRISSDPLRPIVARELILKKYAQEFKQHPSAQIILLKRLGKLNTLLGRWREAWRWFVQAAADRPVEWIKVVAWLVLQRPWAVKVGEDPLRGRYFGWVLLMAAVVACYSQWGALTSAWVVNDDACQHIWWMRSFTQPGLFTHDILAEYARSLQNFGILALYRTTAGVIDPLKLAGFLPLVLLPIAAGALYRLVWGWTRDAYTALLTSVAFMVTPLYLQHMTGGHAHVFGYPLLLLFLYFLMARAYRGAAYVMVTAVFFFPVVFALGGVIWLMAWFFRREQGKVLLMAAAAGLMFLAVKFIALTPASIGHVLSKQDVAHMPELTSAGRWAIWPVENFLQAMIWFVESGVFLFKGMYKTFLPSAWKDVLLAGHLLLAVLALASGAWWWGRRKDVSWMPIVWIVAASAVLYGIAAQVMLKLYAPDRYVSYTLAVAGLLFIMIPIGMIVSSWPVRYGRAVLKVVVLLLVFSCVPLVKGAGLTDYGRHRDLYEFLGTLPKDALIAAYPDTADGIPLFSRRSVLVNAELSVPLYDRYWEIVKARTYDLLGAYYAPDAATVHSFCHRYGVTHLVVERDRFSPGFLNGRVYFEPFGSWIKACVKTGSLFYLNELPPEACMWAKGDMCVIDVSMWK